MRVKFTIIGLGLLCCFGMQAAAQENTDAQVAELAERVERMEKSYSWLNKIKISGYIQGQYQYGQKDASLKVGAGNSDKSESFNRIGVRRGRIKFAFDEKIFGAVFQLDITEKKVGFKDAYLNIKDPWIGAFALRAGIFDRPFGFEIGYSSSRRESPERSTVFQTLFPDERDLGGMLVFQPSKKSSWNWLKIEAGLFAGNGIQQETDNRKDFIGHISANKTFGKDFKLAGGFSYYNGSVYRGTANTYKMSDKSFAVHTSASGGDKFSKREYFGLDLQFSADWAAGLTQIRGEYLWGQQPGTAGSSKSPNSSSLPTADTYIREFSGWYVMLVQDLGRLPLSAVVKYDVYDPNTKVSKHQIGQGGTSKTDTRQNTLGMGLLWRAAKNFHVQAYYEFVNYEKSDNLPALEDLKADVFTLRLQYKF